MRVWHPIPVVCLDNKRLLGEHVEIHTIYNVITLGKKGYSNHPEVNRWRGFISALIQRHNDVAIEMLVRGMDHKSQLGKPESLPIIWPDTIEPIGVMRKKLYEKVRNTELASQRTFLLEKQRTKSNQFS